MKSNHLAAIVTLSGLLLTGAACASAESYCQPANPQAVQQFLSETSQLTIALRVKEGELSDLNAYSMSDSRLDQGPDIRRINALEAEIEKLKDTIQTAARNNGIVVLP
ncbi:MAG TPA: hypothetical protein VJ550_16390 [Geomonas sp.]|nr:hypothetical protein [Geomonas sp.]